MRFRRSTQINSGQHVKFGHWRWYHSTPEHARPLRRARSYAATYRHINQQRRALHALARQDLDMWTRLNGPAERRIVFSSVMDAIMAEMHWIRRELYCDIAKGVYVEHAFEARHRQAEATCQRWNERQEELQKQWYRKKEPARWGTPPFGHYSDAYQFLRHAVRMHQQIIRSHK